MKKWVKIFLFVFIFQLLDFAFFFANWFPYAMEASQSDMSQIFRLLFQILLRSKFSADIYDVYFYRTHAIFIIFKYFKENEIFI